MKFIVGGKRKFATLDEARAYASRVFASKGIIVSIERL